MRKIILTYIFPYIININPIIDYLVANISFFAKYAVHTEDAISSTASFPIVPTILTIVYVYISSTYKRIDSFYFKLSFFNVLLANLIVLITKALSSANRISSIFDVQSSMKEDGNEVVTEEEDVPILEFENVGFCYTGAGEESFSFRHLKAFHCLEATESILDASCHNVVYARHTVCRRWTLKKDKRRCAFALRHTLCEKIVLIPLVQNLLVYLRQVKLVIYRKFLFHCTLL